MIFTEVSYLCITYIGPYASSLLGLHSKPHQDCDTQKVSLNQKRQTRHFQVLHCQGFFFFAIEYITSFHLLLLIKNFVGLYFFVVCSIFILFHLEVHTRSISGKCSFCDYAITIISYAHLVQLLCLWLWQTRCHGDCPCYFIWTNYQCMMPLYGLFSRPITSGHGVETELLVICWQQQVGMDLDCY